MQPNFPIKNDIQIHGAASTDTGGSSSVVGTGDPPHGEDSPPFASVLASAEAEPAVTADNEVATDDPAAIHGCCGTHADPKDLSAGGAEHRRLGHREIARLVLDAVDGRGDTGRTSTRRGTRISPTHKAADVASGADGEKKATGGAAPSRVSADIPAEKSDGRLSVHPGDDGRSLLNERIKSILETDGRRRIRHAEGAGNAQTRISAESQSKSISADAHGDASRTVTAKSDKAAVQVTPDPAKHASNLQDTPRVYFTRESGKGSRFTNSVRSGKSAVDSEGGNASRPSDVGDRGKADFAIHKPSQRSTGSALSRAHFSDSTEPTGVASYGEESAETSVHPKTGPGTGGAIGLAGRDAAAMVTATRVDAGVGETMSTAQLPHVDSADLREGLLKQIVDRATVQIRNQQQEIQIDLKPEHLGHLRIQVQTDQQTLSVRLVTETAMAKDLIETHLVQLKTEMTHQGLGGDQLEIDVSVSGESAQRDPGHAQSRQANLTGSAHEGGNGPDDNSEAMARETASELDRLNGAQLVGVFA